MFYAETLYLSGSIDNKLIFPLNKKFLFHMDKVTTGHSIGVGTLLSTHWSDALGILFLLQQI